MFEWQMFKFKSGIALGIGIKKLARNWRILTYFKIQHFLHVRKIILAKHIAGIQYVLLLIPSK